MSDDSKAPEGDGGSETIEITREWLTQKMAKLLQKETSKHDPDVSSCAKIGGLLWQMIPQGDTKSHRDEELDDIRKRLINRQTEE